MHGDISGLHALADAPRYVFAEGLRFRLGKGTEQGDQELAGFCQGVDVLLFKQNADVPGLEHSNGVQAVHSVPGEPGQGFCEDHVDAPTLASGDHAIKGITLLHVRTADALVCIDASVIPVGIVRNELGVIGFLSFVAVQLFLRVRADAAVGGNAHFSAF